MTKQFNLMEVYEEIKKANPKLSNDKIMELVNAKYEDAMKKAPKEGGKKEAFEKAWDEFKNDALFQLSSKDNKYLHLSPAKKDDPQPLWCDVPNDHTIMTYLKGILKDIPNYDLDEAHCVILNIIANAEEGASVYNCLNKDYARLVRKTEAFQNDLKALKEAKENKKEAPIE